MPTFNDLTYFDLVVACMLFFFLVRGLWIGCVRQLAAFLALIGGYVLAGQYAHAILPLTERVVDAPKLTFLVSFGVIFLVVAIVFTLIGKVLHRVLQITLLGWLDRLAGLVIGGAKAAVMASLLYMYLASSLSATNELLRTSFTTPYLQQGAEVLRSLINDPRLRKYLVQKQPAIATELLPGRSHEDKPEQRQAAKQD